MVLQYQMCVSVDEMNEDCDSWVHSVFLGKIKEAFDRDSELQNLLLDSFFSNAVQECQVHAHLVFCCLNMKINLFFLTGLSCVSCLQINANKNIC